MNVVASLVLVLVGALLWNMTSLNLLAVILMAIGLAACLLSLIMGYGRGETALDRYLPGNRRQPQAF